MHIIFRLFVFVLIVSSCTQKDNAQFNTQELETEWVRLTKTDSTYIVYNSCDAGNMHITLKGENIILHGEQEDSEFTILEFLEVNKIITLVKTISKSSNEAQSFVFIWIDKEKGLGSWGTEFSNGHSWTYSFVLKDKASDYITVDQPCVECWGEECDDLVLDSVTERENAFKTALLKDFSFTDLDQSSQNYRQLSQLRNYSNSFNSSKVVSDSLFNNQQTYFKDRRLNLEMYMFGFSNADSISLGLDSLFKCFPNDCHVIFHKINRKGKFTPSIYIINKESVFVLKTDCENENDKWIEIATDAVELLSDNSSTIILTKCGELFWTSKRDFENTYFLKSDSI